MRQFGIDNNCIDEDAITGQTLIEMFDQIEQNLGEISQKQRQVGAELCKRVQGDFKAMIDEIRAIHENG